jgi:hypothetical protein
MLEFDRRYVQSSRIRCSFPSDARIAHEKATEHHGACAAANSKPVPFAGTKSAAVAGVPDGLPVAGIGAHQRLPEPVHVMHHEQRARPYSTTVGEFVGTATGLRLVLAAFMNGCGVDVAQG